MGPICSLTQNIGLWSSLINEFGDSQEAESIETIARAMYDEGFALSGAGKIAAYDRLIDRFDNSQGPGIIMWVAKAMFNK